MSKLHIKNRKQMLMHMYFTKYDSLILDRETTARLIRKSTSTLDSMRKDGIGPEYSKDERSTNGAVVYAIDHVVDYIISLNEQKTA